QGSVNAVDVPQWEGRAYQRGASVSISTRSADPADAPGSADLGVLERITSFRFGEAFFLRSLRNSTPTCSSVRHTTRQRRRAALGELIAGMIASGTPPGSATDSSAPSCDASHNVHSIVGEPSPTS